MTRKNSINTSKKSRKILLKNVESRTPIRLSKFLASLFTHTSSFIFEKNHVSNPPFSGSGKNVLFSGKYQHCKMFIMLILGVPKMPILENHNYEIPKNNVLFRK